SKTALQKESRRALCPTGIDNLLATPMGLRVVNTKRSRDGVDWFCRGRIRRWYSFEASRGRPPRFDEVQISCACSRVVNLSRLLMRVMLLSPKSFASSGPLLPKQRAVGSSPIARSRYDF